MLRTRTIPVHGGFHLYLQYGPRRPWCPVEHEDGKMQCFITAIEAEQYAYHAGLRYKEAKGQGTWENNDE